MRLQQCCSSRVAIWPVALIAAFCTAPQTAIAQSPSPSSAPPVNADGLAHRRSEAAFQASTTSAFRQEPATQETSNANALNETNLFLDPSHQQPSSSQLSLLMLAMLCSGLAGLVLYQAKRHQKSKFIQQLQSPQQFHLQEPVWPQSTDPLTGLGTRHHFLQRGERLIKSSVHAGHQIPTFALLCINIEHFKAINTPLGYEEGDEILRQLAQRLRGCLRQQDILARVSGDLFGVLLYACELDDAKQIAQRILMAWRKPLCLSPGYPSAVKLTPRLGIAMSDSEAAGKPEQLSTAPVISKLLVQAELAANQAKILGQEQPVVFQPQMQADAIARCHRMAQLQQAIPNHELRLHFQPIFGLCDERPVALEALVRWQHPTEGLLLPQDFLPLATELNLMRSLDRWVLRQACQSLARWQSHHPHLNTVGIHVNLSAASLESNDLLADVEHCLQTYPIRPEQLTFEILEETFVDKTTKIPENLYGLRALGVFLSLDDFGTGYSSLSYLHRLPITSIKVDQSFVRNLHDGPQNEEILRSILALAARLGLETVAEGVEMAPQLSRLKQLQCNYGQGFLLSHGLDEESTGDFLKRYAIASPS